MTKDQILAQYDSLLELATVLAPEIAGQVSEALSIGRDLVQAGHTDPEARLRELRQKTADEWKAALEGRFGAAGSED